MCPIMEVQRIPERRPARPMRMGGVVGTLIEVAPPRAASQILMPANKRLNQTHRDSGGNRPRRRLPSFRNDNRRHRMADRDCLSLSGIQRRVLRQSPRCSCRILHVIHQECPAAVDLEIKMPQLRQRLKEKLHATVQANHVLKLRAPGDHISIIHFKPSQQICPIKQNAPARSRPMLAASRMKV